MSPTDSVTMLRLWFCPPKIVTDKWLHANWWPLEELEETEIGASQERLALLSIAKTGGSSGAGL